MTYTVLWTASAENELAVLWVGSTDRLAVTSAVTTIDHLLRVSPLTSGESREESTRILFVQPLGVDFEVCEDDRKVFVLSVWSIAK